jgi:hypothetical protein
VATATEYNTAVDATEITLDSTLTNTGNFRKINGYSFNVSFYSAEGDKLSDRTFTVDDIAVALGEEDSIIGLKHTAEGNVSYVSAALVTLDIESISSFLHLDMYGMDENISPLNKTWSDILYAIAACAGASALALAVLGICFEFKEILIRIASLLTAFPFACVIIGSILNGGFKNTFLFWGVLIVIGVINGYSWVSCLLESFDCVLREECLEAIVTILTTAALAVLTLFGFTWVFVALFALSIILAFVKRVLL